ncbi:hypothetical protein SASPL_152140 [Salvia splendens]|uniref:Uncharacterized protein n=1 Tax=Salvia splendens TaxID=180675 RepID=A0A8X8W2U1_SALSN|nr:hypothetical protein SASPL_152140 [Salvia splendens]
MVGLNPHSYLQFLDDYMFIESAERVLEVMEKGEGERHDQRVLLGSTGEDEMPPLQGGACEVNVAVFTALIDTSAKNGSLDKVREVSLQMRRCRGKVSLQMRLPVPHRLSWEGGACEGGCLRRWPGVASPVTPTVTTLLIDALAKKGKVYEAVVLVRMVERG